MSRSSYLARTLGRRTSQHGVHLVQQRRGAFQVFHRFIGMQGTQALITLPQRQDLDSRPCRTRHFDSYLALLVRHRMTYHHDPHRPFPQALPQPGKPAAYLHGKVAAQDAFARVEEHVVMPITNQACPRGCHTSIDLPETEFVETNLLHLAKPRMSSGGHFSAFFPALCHPGDVGPFILHKFAGIRRSLRVFSVVW